MDLLVFILYISVLSWWEVYLRTIEAPDLMGSLVALFCSIYLVHFTFVSALSIIFGSALEPHEKAD